MKNVFFIAVIGFFGFLSCRNDDLVVQQIDQVLNIYIDSAGQDMLNSTLANSYTTVQMNDVLGLTDNAPVSFNLKKSVDTINYVEYIAGARRLVIDSLRESKTYESRIALLLTKRLNDSMSTLQNDTMVIQYESTPEIFQISKVFYNRILQFTKVGNEPNIVKIQK